MIGIDYGSKRVGVAVSDESGKFALPFVVIPNSADLLTEIEEIAVENDVKEIVMGDSRNYDMTANKIQPAILEFKSQLEAKEFTVYLEPEFMTSVQAERLQGKNDKSDASAAALILQSFLDKQDSDNK